MMTRPFKVLLRCVSVCYFVGSHAELVYLSKVMMLSTIISMKRVDNNEIPF